MDYSSEVAALIAEWFDGSFIGGPEMAYLCRRLWDMERLLHRWDDDNGMFELRVAAMLNKGGFPASAIALRSVGREKLEYARSCVAASI